MADAAGDGVGSAARGERYYQTQRPIGKTLLREHV
jgi:hypothetical protein